jgi:hypothetical protein
MMLIPEQPPTTSTILLFLPYGTLEQPSCLRTIALSSHGAVPDCPAASCRALLDLPPPRYFVLPYYADKLKQLLDINVAIQDGEPLQYEIIQLEVSSRTGKDPHLGG